MKRIAHISDIHFGREDPAVVEGLLADLTAAVPDVVVISGDLTQRARKRQFRAARDFLRSLPNVPQLVVPGNHDLSATNLVARALSPMGRYKHYISPDLAPFYLDQELAIAGINTVRTLRRKDGRISARQVRTACAHLESAPSDRIRIIVTHHPMDLPVADVDNAVVWRAAMAMRAFASARVDLFLSGHLHAGLSVASSARYNLPGYSAIVVHAGTAVSTRTRGVPNAWNLLRVDSDVIVIQQRVWRKTAFIPGGNEVYRKRDDGWAIVSA